jgi:hypothetical protein
MQASLTRRTKHESPLEAPPHVSDRIEYKASTTRIGAVMAIAIILIFAGTILFFHRTSSAPDTENHIQPIPQQEQQTPQQASVVVEQPKHHFTIHTIEKVQAQPGDEQCDRKNVVITPGRFENYDPFLMMFEDWIGPTKGFLDHPHRGIETVTLVLEGGIEHGDNRGNVGVLEAGDVQWTTTGSGIIHKEMPNGKLGGHTLQVSCIYCC